MADLLVSPRVRRTDRALSAASVRVAAEEGWGDFTFARVAREAGTSRRPLQDRFAGRSELAAATWTEAVEPALRGLVVEFLASAGLLHSAPDRERFVAVILRDGSASGGPDLLRVRKCQRRSVCLPVVRVCRTSVGTTEAITIAVNVIGNNSRPKSSRTDEPPRAGPLSLLAFALPANQLGDSGSATKTMIPNTAGAPAR